MKRTTKHQWEKIVILLSMEIKTNYPHLYDSVGGQYVNHYLRTRTRIPKNIENLPV